MNRSVFSACVVSIVALLGLACSIPERVVAVARPSKSFSCGSSTTKFDSAKLEQTLKRVQKEYQGVTGLRANFLQRSYIEALDMSEVSKGEVWFENPGKMKWDYREPESQVFVLKDNTHWYYQEEEHQLIIDSVDRVLVSALPVSFLLGIGDLTREFEPESGCELEVGMLLVLKPRVSEDDSSTLKQFSLLVSKETFLPVGAMVSHLNGNRDEFLFREEKFNLEIPADTFDVEVEKGTDVNDRREQVNRAGEELR